MKRILIAVDQSPVSAQAAREAVRLFGSDDCEYLLLNVAQGPAAWVPASDYGVVTPMALPWDVGMNEQELEAAAAAAGVPDATVLTDSGPVAAVIVAAADEHNADVIVVGSHHKGLLDRLLEPSVSDAVVRTTARPVLVVTGRA